MANKLRPGNFSNNNQADFSAFTNSMAAQIEKELNTLLLRDGLPELLDDVNNREVRDRRRFIVAIARGVVQHLVSNADAFSIQLDANRTVHPTISME